MRSSFLPKSQPKITEIFALPSKGQLISKCLYEIIVWTKIPTKILIVSALAGQKLSKFLLVFWSKRRLQKGILKLTDLYYIIHPCQTLLFFSLILATFAYFSMFWNRIFFSECFDNIDFFFFLWGGKGWFFGKLYIPYTQYGPITNVGIFPGLGVLYFYPDFQGWRS